MTAPDSTQMDSLVAARMSAIDASGWGRRFAFIQPRNLAFWVYVVLVLVDTLDVASARAIQYARTLTPDPA